MVLPQPLRNKVRASGRRFVVTGVTGWIGRTAAALLAEALGEEAGVRLACYGSREGTIALAYGREQPVRPLVELPDLAPAPTALLHLAFLTMDKVGLISEADYIAANRLIAATVRGALDRIGADLLFLASSGAAARADDAKAPAALRVYGALKLEDERVFADWADACPAQRRAAICRVYSVSGAGINKPATYALADLILRGLAGEAISVRSPREVWRSYVAVPELVALALAVLLDEANEPVTRFDSGGTPMELAEVAAHVARHFGTVAPERAITAFPADFYCGDHPAWVTLLGRHGLSHLPFPRQLEATTACLAGLESEPTHA